VTNFDLRPASPADALSIAQLISIASDGISDYLWSRDASPGEEPLAYAQRRYQRDDINIGYRNSTIVCRDDETIGLLLAFPIIVDPEYIETDPVLAPMARLEEADSYYICSMAVFDEFRGAGIGSRLLGEAEQQCQDLGLTKLSLIVFEENSGARRLYEHNGYIATKRATLVPHPLIRVTGDVLLMIKHL
jgi:ribosomal protein S18 acetylase RimI-like enzyme